jgi:hypothetical protein
VLIQRLRSFCGTEYFSGFPSCRQEPDGVPARCRSEILGCGCISRGRFAETVAKANDLEGTAAAELFDFSRSAAARAWSLKINARTILLLFVSVLFAGHRSEGAK